MSESKARELYRDTIILMRRLFHDCKLVHADLSEFNMLYFEGKVFIIDVSQSVEHDHPHALEFLRKDCTNITDFFKKNSVCTMTVKELFDFVVDPSINSDNIDVINLLINIEKLLGSIKRCSIIHVKKYFNITLTEY